MSLRLSVGSSVSFLSHFMQQFFIYMSLHDFTYQREPAIIGLHTPQLPTEYFKQFPIAFLIPPGLIKSRIFLRKNKVKIGVENIKASETDFYRFFVSFGAHLYPSGP